jgi:hypothetical protein
MTRIGKTMLLAGAMALPLGSLALAQETGGGGGATTAASVPIPTVGQPMLNNAASDSKNFLHILDVARRDLIGGVETRLIVVAVGMCMLPGSFRPTCANRWKLHRLSSMA